MDIETSKENCSFHKKIQTTNTLNIWHIFYQTPQTPVGKRRIPNKPQSEKYLKQRNCCAKKSRQFHRATFKVFFLCATFNFRVLFPPESLAIAILFAVTSQLLLYINMFYCLFTQYASYIERIYFSSKHTSFSPWKQGLTESIPLPDTWCLIAPYCIFKLRFVEIPKTLRFDGKPISFFEKNGARDI